MAAPFNVAICLGRMVLTPRALHPLRYASVITRCLFVYYRAQYSFRALSPAAGWYAVPYLRGVLERHGWHFVPTTAYLPFYSSRPCLSLPTFCADTGQVIVLYAMALVGDFYRQTVLRRLWFCCSFTLTRYLPAWRGSGFLLWRGAVSPHSNLRPPLVGGTSHGLKFLVRTCCCAKQRQLGWRSPLLRPPSVSSGPGVARLGDTGSRAGHAALVAIHRDVTFGSR